METSILKKMDCLFNPRSIAVVGASDTFGKWGCDILSSILASGGERKVYPVSKSASELRGIKTYESVRQLPEPVDFALIAVPFQNVPAVMRDCVARGIPTAEVITSGLAEADDAGAELEQEIAAIARGGGIRFIGPNCMGHLDAWSQFFTLPLGVGVKRGAVGVVSQSGTVGTSILLRGTEMGIGFSKSISCGNEADLHLEDFLEYLGQDEDTRVIVCYIEGLREGRRFRELARDITRRKPVLAMKAARTASGAKAAKSHAAALAGSSEVLDAVLKQAGVIRVEEVDELVDVAAALSCHPLPRGRKIGILTEGGGMGVVATDVCIKFGLEIAPLSPSTMSNLDTILPSRWPHGNPVDMVAASDVTYPCLWAMLGDEGIDAVLLVGGISDASNAWVLNSLGLTPSSIREEANLRLRSREAAQLGNLDLALERMHLDRKPVIFCLELTRDTVASQGYTKLQQNGIPVYPTVERGARVLAHLAWYGEYLSSKATNRF